jgi:hypothetical protein
MSRDGRACSAPPLHFGGIVAYYEPRPHPKLARRRAKRLGLSAQIALGHAAKDAEQIGRTAVEHLVDAFLLDREGCADCFADAHRLGRELERRFGCPMTLDDAGQHWSTDCGVLALHQRLGWSPGGPTLGECSICGAHDFECDHVPGERYDGQHCYRIIVEWDLREISLVSFPNDPRCYRVVTGHPVRVVEQARGHPLLPGERPTCTHCRDCYGAAGPTAEDVDQSLWPDPMAGRNGDGP